MQMKEKSVDFIYSVCAKMRLTIIKKEEIPTEIWYNKFTTTK